MGSQDWNNLGNSIRDMVEDAVNSHDYRKLNQNICNMIADGLESVADTISGGLKGGASSRENAPHSATGYGRPPYKENRETSYRAEDGQPCREPQAGRSGGQPAGGQPQFRQQTGGNSARPVNSAPGYRRNLDGPGASAAYFIRTQPEKYARTTGRKAGGMMLTISGGVLLGAVGALLLLLLITFLFLEDGMSNMAVTTGILAPFLICGGILVGKGGGLLGRIRRFEQYVRELHEKDYCEIKDLARQIRKSEKYVQSDLKKLIRRGWFRQGHLDPKGTCLMVTNEAYSQYCMAEKELEDRKRKESEERRRQEAARREKEAMPEDVKGIMDAGNEYLAKIRKSNAAIPGEEISCKISRMETIITRIFKRVEEHPEFVPDLHKFMDYYLPTTVKLLDAYEELDSQPVQGENIKSSKAEIEKTLDTLNMAFEKLLDSLFEDTAWDVATDITVLQNMLAQEGLTQDRMKQPEA